eukprot:scaffold4570_cov81-Cylindrotheca_fusiformis.AAC.6
MVGTRQISHCKARIKCDMPLRRNAAHGKKNSHKDYPLVGQHGCRHQEKHACIRYLAFSKAKDASGYPCMQMPSWMVTD